MLLQQLSQERYATLAKVILNAYIAQGCGPICPDGASMTNPLVPFILTTYRLTYHWQGQQARFLKTQPDSY